MLLGDSSANSDRSRVYKTGSMIVVALLVCMATVGFVSSGNRPTSSVVRKEAIGSELTRAVATVVYKKAEDTQTIWDEKDEMKFRKGIAKEAKKWKEEQFVERLVNEWKLTKKYRLTAAKGVRGDGLFDDLGRLIRTMYYYPDKNQYVGPLGGNGGGPFGLGLYVPHAKISRIDVRSGALVDRIQVTYAGGESIQGGGWGGSPHHLTLGSNDCIGQVVVGAGVYVDSIWFKKMGSNNLVSHDYGRWGGGGGEIHIITRTNGACLRSITGRSGSLVDQVNLIFG